MKRAIELALVFMIGVLFVLALVFNARYHEKRQNKAQNYSVGQLH